MRIIEPTGVAEFRRYYDLRWRILRAPWDQPRGSERDAQDDGSTHLMLIDDGGKPMAVGRLHFNTIREAQIRYMAVEVAHQRSGLGSRLLAALEHRAHELGASVVVLDARETALGFYCKHGYRVCGSGHTLFHCIAHVQMSKSLDGTARQGR
jgi:predicted GNAT family N-acyltransferase